VAPAPTAAVLRLAVEGLEGRLEPDDASRMELESIATALERLPARRRTDPASVAERRRERTVTQRRLRALYEASREVAEAVDAAVAAFNGTPGEPGSFDRLDALLDDQAYRLAFWRVAAEEINYRRFFDVNDLAGVRVEVPRVFADTHRLVLRLVREGKVTGLRIDHPDGLYDPRGYLRDLQVETAGLEAERTPSTCWWRRSSPATRCCPRLAGGGHGRLRVPEPGERPLRPAPQRAGDGRRLPRLHRRRAALRGPGLQPQAPDPAHLAGERADGAGHLLNRISETNRCSRDFTYGSLLDALREVMACFPVYRTYVDAAAGRVSEADRGYVQRAVKAAKRRNRGISREIFDFLEDVVLLRWPASLGEEERAEYALFVMKLQQLTGPVMAKGVEDTSFYVFNRLVSLNEVGGEPDRFGVEPAELHAWLAERARRWPTPCRRPPRTTPSAARTCAPASTCWPRSPDLWSERVNAWQGLNAALLATPTASRCPTPTTSTCSTRRWWAPGPGRAGRPGGGGLHRPRAGATWRRRPARPRCTRAGSTRTRSTTAGWPTSWPTCCARAAPSWTTSSPSSAWWRRRGWSTRWRRR
jgi:(1->4)-alpha-D-glucan 1-alpha-D-glucosylmutase